MINKIKSIKFNNSNLKRAKPLVFLGAILLFSAIAVTLAIFTSESSIANRFQAMTYDVTLEEEFYDTWGTKKVVIANNDDKASVILRVSYIEIWSQKVGDNVFTLSNKVNGEDTVIKDWTSEFKDNFIDGKDGWYYYTKVLKPNQSVQILNMITKNDTLLEGLDDYKDYDYELTFSYEAIQASEKAANDLWEKVITIDGDNITWKS